MVAIKLVGMNRLQKRMKRVARLPQYARDAMREIGGNVVDKLIETAQESGIQPGNNGGNYGIHYEQAPKGNQGLLYIPASLVTLDSMTPHFVTMRTSRSGLVSWGQQAQNPGIRFVADQVAAGTSKRASIFVRPHSFISDGLVRGLADNDRIIKKHSKKVHQ